MSQKKATFKSKGRAPATIGEAFVDCDLLAKRKRYAPSEPPALPGAAGGSRFSHYDAIMSSVTGSIIVTDAVQASDLFARGSYGKGMLSRSQPDYDVRRHRLRANLEQELANVQKILQLRRRLSRSEPSSTKSHHSSSTLSGKSRQWFSSNEGPPPASARAESVSAVSRPPFQPFFKRRLAGELGSFKNIESSLEGGMKVDEIRGKEKKEKVDEEDEEPPSKRSKVDSLSSSSSLAFASLPATSTSSKSSAPTIIPVVKTASKRRFRGPVSYSEYISRSTEELLRDEKRLQSRVIELRSSLVAPIGGEPLLLHPIEAFFLVHDMDCLHIRTSAGADPLTSKELWQRFVREDARFPASYAVYFFFRARNWCPKNGLKFGTDWVLYHGGPEYSHAAFQILFTSEVKRPSTTCSEGAGSDAKEETFLAQFGTNYACWPTIHHLSRLAEGVCKLLCIVRVMMPEKYLSHSASTSSTREKFESQIDALIADGPSCIDSFEILPIVIRRWVNRELDENEAGRNW